MPVPVDLAPYVNVDRLAPEGKDLACLRGEGPADLPRELVLKVGGPAAAVRVRWTVDDAPAWRPGPGMNVLATFADGQTLLARPIIGRELFAEGTPSRLAEPVSLGVDAAGRTVAGSEWVFPLGRGDVALDTLRFSSRAGNLRICVASVERLAEWGWNTHLRGPDWYPFAIAGAFTGALPQVEPVTGPVGRHGFVTQGPDGHLVHTDGTRARFWGVNAVGDSSVPARADAEAYATTLAALGYNLVRIHHYDGPPPRGIVNPSRKGEADLFLPGRLEDLDHWIAALEARGVYVLLEIATERELVAADGVSDPGGAPAGHKLYPMWEPDWLQAYLRWFDRVWDRTNTVTGRRYAEDPGIALLELSNEHTLLLFWGFGLERLPEVHLARLDAAWNTWLRGRYPDDAALAAAWAGGPNGGLRPGEGLGGATVRREPLYPAVFDRWPAARRRDLHQFYRSLEEGFYQAVADHVRSRGFRVPLVPSITFDQPELQLLQAPYRVADIHVYRDPLRGAYSSFEGDSALRRPAPLLRYALNAPENGAMLVTELSQPFPNPWRSEAPLLWATFAARQDWDALVWMPYADGAYQRDVASLPGSFEQRTTPVQLAQSPTASSLFRAGLVPPATGSWLGRLDPETVAEQFIQNDLHTRQPAFVPLLLGEPGFVLAHRIRARLGGALPPPTTPGDPGPVGWYPDPGVLFVDTPLVQARVGDPGAPGTGGAGPTRLSGLDVRLTGWAAVSLACTRLDGEGCREGLLTVATRQENTGQELANQGTELAAWGTAPVVVEPARGVVRVRWPTRPLVEVLDGQGAGGGTVPARRVGGGWWELRLDEVRSPWLRISG